MNESRWLGTMLAVGIIAFLLMVIFLVALISSTAGEVASAIGAVIGGGIGAGGSALAVILAFRNQQHDESRKTYESVICEVAELSRFVVGNLGACLLIKEGFTFPRKDLDTMMNTPNVLVYPAIADHISRLPNPTLVVSFYTRFEELKGVIQVVQRAPAASEMIEPDQILGISDLVISMCQIAKILLDGSLESSFDDGGLSKAARHRLLQALDHQLEQAKKAFPDAESFQGWIDDPGFPLTSPVPHHEGL